MRAFASLLLIVSLAAGQPPRPGSDVVPRTMSAPVGSLAVIAASTTGAVYWDSVADASTYYIDSGKKTFIVTSAVSGTLRVLCIESIDGKLSTYATLVTFTPAGPLPIDDQLLKTLQDAWAKEMAPDKETSRGLLRALYASAAKMPMVEATIGEMTKNVATAGRTLLGDSLPLVRMAVSVELARLLPDPPDTPLDVNLKSRAAGAYARAAKFLDLMPGPGPGPTPVPPTPDPPSPKPPLPGDGLRALLIFSTSDLTKLPKEQGQIFTARDVRAYLDAKSAKGIDGKTPEYRVLDKEVDTSKDAAWVGIGMGLPRTELPWVIIANGKTGFSGPLPKTVAETLALLKKYGN